MIPMNLSSDMNSGDVKKQISALKTQMASLKDAIEQELMSISYEQLDTNLKKKIDNLTDLMALNMESQDATFGKITAIKATVDTINANYISAGTVAAQYASIGSLNAQIARIDNIVADYIKASEISAIQISANQITSGTISANRISSDIMRTSSFSAANIASLLVGTNLLSVNYITLGNGITMNLENKVKYFTPNNSVIPGYYVLTAPAG